MKNAIVLLGAPGCGKGTQAKYILEDNKFHYICIGEVLREKKSTDEALKAKLASGMLIDSAYINNLLDEEIAKRDSTHSNNTNTILLDGYPRTIDQAMHLAGKYKVFVLYFEIEEKFLSNRIAKRKVCLDCKNSGEMEDFCSNCNSSNLSKREDDNAETVKKRFQEYQENTAILIDFYQKNIPSNQFYKVNAGDGEAIEIYNSQISYIINKILDN